jgi:hypothetical protein
VVDQDHHVGRKERQRARATAHLDEGIGLADVLI